MADRSPQPLHEFRLPDLGEGLTEAELVSWSVAVGDTVALNQVIVQVETAKAVVELPSPYAGTVLALLAEPGATVAVGAPLIRIGEPGAGPAEGSEPGPEASGSGSVLVGYGPTAAAPSRRRTPGAAAPPTPGSAASTPVRPDAKPSARKLARELGVDLSEVPGSGAGGAITTGDVRACHDAAEPSAPQPDATAARETRTPIRGVRKQTADAVVRSAFTAPHVTEFLTVDVTASMDLLATLRATPAYTGLKLTPLALVARVLVAMLRAHPALNSSWDEERQEIVTRHYVNLGIAAATPRGLLVPTIRDAHLMGLLELTRAIDDLAETARAGRATPTDLSGATVSITNVGVFGVDAGTPILGPGQAAILCLGAIRPRPWVVEDRVVVRQVVTLGLSFDHRLVDGEQGSRFLADVGATLTDPLTLL